MKTPLRKLVLAIHLTFSIGWIGALLVYLALGLTAVRSSDLGSVRAAWTAMEIAGWYVIVPLSVASLITGVIIALGTRWGLFRHYWVLISFVLTTFATVVLVFHMPDVSALADMAQESKGANLAALGGDLMHPALGLVVLLAVQVLNIYKPQGLTRYGWRKQQETARTKGEADVGSR